MIFGEKSIRVSVESVVATVFKVKGVKKLLENEFSICLEKLNIHNFGNYVKKKVRDFLCPNTTILFV